MSQSISIDRSINHMLYRSCVLQFTHSTVHLLVPPHPTPLQPPPEQEPWTYTATFKKGPLGLKIKTDSKNNKGTVVVGASEGSQAAAKDDPAIIKGDVVVTVDGQDVRGKPKKDVLEAIKGAERPLDIEFETTRVKKDGGDGDDGDGEGGGDGMEFKVDESEITESAAPGNGAGGDAAKKEKKEEGRKKKEEEQAAGKKKEEKKEKENGGGGGFFGGLFG